MGLSDRPVVPVSGPRSLGKALLAFRASRRPCSAFLLQPFAALAAQSAWRPALSSAAQPAEQGAPVHVYARIERESGFFNSGSVLFASLRTMKSQDRSSHFDAKIKFALRVSSIAI